MAQASRRAAPVVPFLDLRSTHESLREKIVSGLDRIIDSGAFVNGPDVTAFEEEWAAYCGSAHCVGVASGLDALRLSLLACGAGPGDEVVVPAMTFVATAEAVTQTGATPVLVDIGPDATIDVHAVAAAVGTRTRAIVPVHLYGQLADMSAISTLATARGLAVVEDACQAHAATRDGLRAGAVGRAGCFSFYPGKNLGAMGDAGAVTTTDDALARRVRALREHGQTAKYRHEVEGFTARLDTFQALVLRHKLPHLDGWTEQRRLAAAFYAERLSGVGDLGLPHVAGGSQPVWHLFTVTTADPTALAAHLAEAGIATGRHYPDPVHLTPAFARLGYQAGSFPVAERLARTTLSLPLYPGLEEHQLEHVVSCVRAYFDGR
jgi:dTDP-4-amino-4,6-dideoxygalactose transaminase